MTLLYAIGVGACVNVAISVLARLFRLAGARFDPSGESLVIGVAAAILVASLGLAARSHVIRLALLGLAPAASVVINRLLGVIITGRAPGDPFSTDAFLFAPPALAALVGALILGGGVGLIAWAYSSTVPWQPPDKLMRAAGVAFVVGTIAGVVWPAPFFAELLGGTELATAAISLPLILAGPLAGGAYAARAGVDYRSITLLGTYVTLPLLVTLVAGTIAETGRIVDPRFEAVARQLRVTIALSWFLVLLRLSGWPLGAAFAQGFLTPEAKATADD